MLLMQRWLFYFLLLLLLLLRSFWFSAGEFFRQKGSLVSKLSIIFIPLLQKTYMYTNFFFLSWETFSVGVSRRLEGPRSMIATGGGKGLDMT